MTAADVQLEPGDILVAKKTVAHGVSIAMQVGVFTGCTKNANRSSPMKYELDFGVGFQCDSDGDSLSGGFYYTAEEIKTAFIKLDTGEDSNPVEHQRWVSEFVVKRPGFPNNVPVAYADTWFWRHRRQERQYRLSLAAASENYLRQYAEFEAEDNVASNMKEVLFITSGIVMGYACDWHHRQGLRDGSLGSAATPRVDLVQSLLQESLVAAHRIHHGTHRGYRIANSEGILQHPEDRADGGYREMTTRGYALFPAGAARGLASLRLGKVGRGSVAPNADDFLFAIHQPRAANAGGLLLETPFLRERQDFLEDLWWQGLDDNRDAVSRENVRFAADAASHSNPMWMRIGERAHAKCQIRTICNTWQYEGGADPLGSVSATPLSIARAHRDLLPTDAPRDLDITFDANYMPIVAPCVIVGDALSNEGPENWRFRGKELTQAYGDDMDGKWWSADPSTSESAVVEHFADNLRAITKAACAMHDSDIGNNSTDRIVELSAEFPVHWQFGTHSKPSGSKLVQLGIGFETLIDLVACRVGLDNKVKEVFIVEYKTRMELNANVKAWFAMGQTSDRIQALLAAWLFYFNTGIMVGRVLVPQATRRRHKQHHQFERNNDSFTPELCGSQQWQEPGSNNRQEPAFGCHAELQFGSTQMGAEGGEPWATPAMVRFITRFAMQPYGSDSRAQYVDDTFFVPNLTALAEAFHMDPRKMFEDDGMHPIFSKILISSRFTKMVNAAAGYANDAFIDGDDTIVLGLPAQCALATASQGENAGLPTVLPPLRLRAGQPRHHPFANIEGQTLTDVYKWILGGPIVGNHTNYIKNETKQYFRNWHAYAPYLQRYWMHQLLENDDPNKHLPAFVPFLFQKATRTQAYPLLFLNPEKAIRIREYGMHNSAANVAAFASAGALVFRRDEALGIPSSLHFGRRLYPAFPQDNDQLAHILEACAALRKQLNGMVENATRHIHGTLNAQLLRIDQVDPHVFWVHSINSIYRRNLSTGPAPLVHEFAPITVGAAGEEDTYLEPYADTKNGQNGPTPRTNSAGHNLRYRPEHLRRFRKDVVRRCVHRLVNTRLLRGALALAGCDVALPEHRLVSPDERDDNGDLIWPNERLQQWKLREHGVIQEMMPCERPPAADGNDDTDENEAWWKEEEGSNNYDDDDDEYSRAECFPHISQRALWTKEALVAVTAATRFADANSSIVDIAKEHILRDLLAALNDYRN